MLSTSLFLLLQLVKPASQSRTEPAERDCGGFCHVAELWVAEIHRGRIPQIGSEPTAGNRWYMWLERTIISAGTKCKRGGNSNAPLGPNVFGHCANCRSPGLYRRCRSRCWYCIVAVHRVFGSVRDFTRCTSHQARQQRLSRLAANADLIFCRESGLSRNYQTAWRSLSFVSGALSSSKHLSQLLQQRPQLTYKNKS
jgi:hypothetical protein